MSENEEVADFKPPRKTSSEDFMGIFEISNPTMSEEVFIRDFLQLMLNPDLRQDLEIAHNSRWIAIAGNPMQPIDVVSKGKVIFTAPPLFSTDKPVLTDDKKHLFTALLRDVKEKSDISPILGDQLLNNYIHVVANNDQTINPAYAAHWRHILEHYKLIDRVSEMYTGKPAAGILNGNQQSTLDVGFTAAYEQDEDA